MKPTLSPARRRPILFGVKKVKNGVVQLSKAHHFPRSAEDRAEMQIRRALNRELNIKVRNAPKKDPKRKRAQNSAKSNAIKAHSDPSRVQRTMELRRRKPELSWGEAYKRVGKS